MTVSSTTNKMIYTGNNDTVFPYSFKISSDTDLVVEKILIATGAATTQTLTTHYTVSGAGDEAGGNVTMLSAVTSAYKLVIRRVKPLTQTTDYVENDPFRAATHEAALDKLTMITQQLQEESNRSLKSNSASTATPVLPTPEDGKIPAWSGTSGSMVNVDIDATALADAVAAAQAAQAAAETAQTNAETAESHAETAETNAETAETNAETAETNAAQSAINAAASASSITGFPSFAANNANTSVAFTSGAAAAVMIWTTEEYDIGSNYSTVTGKFTAPSAGTYVFHSSVYCSTTANKWFSVNLGIYKNGSLLKLALDGRVASATTVYFVPKVTVIDRAAANDTYEVRILQESEDAASKNLGGYAPGSYFCGSRVN